MTTVGFDMRNVLRWLLRAARDCAGGPLIETVVALSVFAMVGTAVLVGVQTIQNSGNRTEDKAVAENLARNQMEHVFNLAYKDATSTYSSISSVQSGYVVTAAANQFVSGDLDVQKVVVTVTRGGESLLVLETLRTR